MKPLPFGSTAVMARRSEPPSSLDYFPTPPWATRALLEHVLLPLGLSNPAKECVWEPACGEGHMSAVLTEYFRHVSASDVFPYGHGNVTDFLSTAYVSLSPDWIITNPPFKTAEEFAHRAIGLASKGAALLVRSAWLEGEGRFTRLFQPCPPAIVAQFCERVPMVKGRWDPKASSATSYSWVVWLKGPAVGGTVFMWIPPGQRAALTRPDDVLRFAPRAPAPLFDEVAA